MGECLGENTIGGKPLKSLRRLNLLSKTERISGSDRYETNKRTLEVGDFTDVGVADGRNFADALSAVNVVVSNNNSAVMLVGNGLSNEQKNLISGVEKKFEIGGNLKLDNGIQIDRKDSVQTDKKDNVQIDKKNNIQVDKKEDIQIGKKNEESSKKRNDVITDKTDRNQSILNSDSEDSSSKNFIKSLSNDKKKEFEEIVKNGASKNEAELYMRINEYRVEKGLNEIAFSKSLTTVARMHVKDLSDNHPENSVDERGVKGNLHSWSNKGNWSPLVYTSDHYHAEGMWSKPSEVTEYRGNGYEIAAFLSGYITPEIAINLWKGSQGHNAVMTSEGNWSDFINIMGVGIDGNYSVVWFGRKADPAGYYCGEK